MKFYLTKSEAINDDLNWRDYSPNKNSEIPEIYRSLFSSDWGCSSNYSSMSGVFQEVGLGGRVHKMSDFNGGKLR